MKSVKHLKIPIYSLGLILVVSDDIRKARKGFDIDFGEGPDFNYAALTCHNGGATFGLFFDSSSVTIKTIAHEAFHLTHRILDYVHGNFDSEHHEQGAFLNDFLVDLLYKNLRKYINNHE